MKSETELIVEHALLSESNLTLAAKIGEAYSQLRGVVIRGFLTRLRDEMRSKLGTDWIVEIEREKQSSPFLYVRGLAWPENFNFGIGSENGCISRVYIWVTKCSVTLGKPLIDPEIRGSLKELEPWRSNQNLWWRLLDKYRDWGLGDTFVEIYRASEALDYAKAHLLKIHGAVAPIIDANLAPVLMGNE